MRCGCRLAKQQEGKLMKFRTIILAAAFTLTSTFALAQAPGLGGYGTVTAPSVGSYPAAGGTTNVPLTWRNTGPAAPLPSVPTAGSAFGNSFAPIPPPIRAPAAPTDKQNPPLPCCPLPFP